MEPSTDSESSMKFVIRNFVFRGFKNQDIGIWEFGGQGLVLGILDFKALIGISVFQIYIFFLVFWFSVFIILDLVFIGCI